MLTQHNITYYIVQVLNTYYIAVVEKILLCAKM